MTIAADLIAAKNLLIAATDKLIAIVHGPASGEDSDVETDGGIVPTLAKVTAAYDVTIAEAEVAVALASASVIGVLVAPPEPGVASMTVSQDGKVMTSELVKLLSDEVAVNYREVSVAPPAPGTTALMVSADGKVLASEIVVPPAVADPTAGQAVDYREAIVAPPIAGTKALMVSQDGKVLSAEKDATASTVPIQTSQAAIARASGRGVRIDSVADIVATNSGNAYAGPRYDGALSLAAPYISGSTLMAKLNWDRKGITWADVEIGASNLVLTSGLVSNIRLIFPCFGQSLSVGGVPSYTGTAPDGTNLLMVENSSSFAHPYFPPSLSATGLVPLRHDTALNATGYGETTLGSMGLQLVARMTAAGAAIPGVYFTAGSGGNSLRDLDEDSAAYMAQTRTGGVFANLMRVISFAKNELLGGGKTPVVMPMSFIHGEEDSGDLNFGMLAAEYARSLMTLADRWNDNLARLMDWAPGAPKLPIVVTQTRRTPPYMWASGAKVLKRGVDGPLLGQWAAPYADQRIVLAGPNYHLPLAGDGSHLSGAGYFRLGEQIARQMWNVVFGRGPSYFRPIAVIRQSTTAIDIVFQLPSGSLALDTTNVADLTDGMKGFVIWDNATNTQLALASVAIQSTNTVRLTLAAGSSSQDLWCDYAVWGNDSSNTAATAGGPRGNLRTDTAYASLISTYGGSATTDYDWCPAFRIPVSFYGGSPRTNRINGRL